MDFEAIVAALIDRQISICYFTSDNEDPGLNLSSDYFASFLIDSGPVRNWLFRNIDCAVFLMTMPDLENFQIKRSKHNVHYVYLQHSLVSLHMIYRHGAFDHFDTIFCSGPHHIVEMESIIRINRLQRKNIVKHGYGRLDSILRKQFAVVASPGAEIPTVLVAPSWGPTCIIETIGYELVSNLLTQNVRTILRPHPQTFKLYPDKVNQIIKKFEKHHLFHLDDGTKGYESFSKAHTMITDWSGAAFDFNLGFDKPIVFIDVDKKINNPQYQKISVNTVEEEVRNEMGAILGVRELDQIGAVIRTLISRNRKSNKEKYVFNLGRSGPVGADSLIEILNRRP